MTAPRFPTYRCTQPQTLSVGLEVIIIAQTARVAELVAVTDLHVIVPPPYMEITKVIYIREGASIGCETSAGIKVDVYVRVACVQWEQAVGLKRRSATEKVCLAWRELSEKERREIESERAWICCSSAIP